MLAITQKITWNREFEKFLAWKQVFFAKKLCKSRDVFVIVYKLFENLLSFVNNQRFLLRKRVLLRTLCDSVLFLCCCCETQLFVINRTVGKKIKPAWLWKLVFSGRITKCQNSWKIGYFWRDFVTTYSTRPWYENQSPNRFLGFVKVLRILLFLSPNIIMTKSKGKTKNKLKIY